MNRARSWLPAVAWAAVIFGLSSFSFRGNESSALLGRYGVDKLVHVVIYAVLGWLVIRALHREQAWRLPIVLGLAILLTSAYGASDEWHQTWVPGRHANPWDWVADTCGAVLAAGLYYHHESRTSRKANRRTP